MTKYCKLNEELEELLDKNKGKEIVILEELDNSYLQELMKNLDYYVMDIPYYIGYENLIERILDLWIFLARISELPLHKIKIYEITTSFSLQTVSQSLGLKIKSSYSGWSVFVDFINSTGYFMDTHRPGYVGFVMFNAANLITKLYVRYLQVKRGNDCCEFLQHTGDGAYLYFSNNNEFFELTEYLFYLYASNIFSSPLVRIGAAFGEGVFMEWENEKSFIAPATWEAARNCKTAPDRFYEGNPFLCAIDFKYCNDENCVDAVKLEEIIAPLEGKFKLSIQRFCIPGKDESFYKIYQLPIKITPKEP